MKYRVGPAVCLCLMALAMTPVCADTTIIVSQSNAASAVLAFSDTPHVVKRDNNFRVWQHTAIDTSPTGKKTTKVHSITELATGICYNQNGQWIDADPQIVVAPDGSGIGAEASHSLRLSPDIATDGGIQFVSQNGMQLSGHILGICYYDWKNRRDVQVAGIRSTIGAVAGKNSVLYSSAFDGVEADVRYTFRKAGFGQDVILKEQLPLPVDFGLDPATTRVEVWTEFLNPPAPTLKTITDDVSGQVFHDIIDFGGARFGRGAAFALPQQDKAKSRLPVNKQWQQIDGRTFLIESIDYPSLAVRISDLPQRPQAAVPRKLPAIAAASTKRNLPRRLVAKNDQTRRLRVAAVNHEQKAYVLDYEVESGAVSDFTFLGDTTYYITGDFDIGGTLTIEGNTVVKYGSSGTVNIAGATICSTASYRPAIFTSQDDDSVGEQISGSTGSPAAIDDNPALYFEGTNTSLHDLHFFYLNHPIYQSGGVVSATNIQCVHCFSPFWLFYTSVSANNSLFFDFGYLMTGAGQTVQLLNDTVCSGLRVLDGTGATSAATNCIFASVTNTDSMAGAYNGFYNSPAFGTLQVTNATDPFQTGAFGNFYLTNGCAFRDQGTTNIDTDLLNSLKRKTTSPPTVHISESITNETIYTQTAQRDMSTSDGLDLGYHYDPIDHIFSQCDAYSNITFTAGTVAAWYRSTSGFYHAGYGIHMDDQRIATFAGTYDQPCYWVRCNTVQEGSAGQPLTVGYGGITGWADQYLQDPTLSPEVHLSFTKCSEMASEISAFFADDWGYLKVRGNNSELHGGYIGNYGISFALTNCLFERSSAGNIEGWTGNFIYLRNCTFHGGGFGVTSSSVQPDIFVEDCSFDTTNVVQTNYGFNGTFDYNGYVVGNQHLTTNVDLSPSGIHDTNVASFNWQSGLAGNYYLPTNSPLIDAGSRPATNAALYHFTTQTNQSKEANTQVDIGYHYLAVDSGGNPLDSDGDGVPDYLEDGNGNGTVDSGETDWQSASDLGLKVQITHPTSGSNIP